MPASIASLPVVTLDYSNRGPGLLGGMKQLESLLNADKGREGYLKVLVIVGDQKTVVPIIMSRSDLYVLGFECSGTWFRFSDAPWPFTESSTSLGHDGQYSSLGGLSGNMTAGAIQGIARLANLSKRSEWKESLRTLLIAVAECARLIPVRMRILGLLNEVNHTSIPLDELAHYVQNWDKASKGQDMSKEISPTHRTGFSDPTIIRR